MPWRCQRDGLYLFIFRLSYHSSHLAFAVLLLGIAQSLYLRRYGFIDCKETHALYGRDIFVHKDIVGHDVFRALRKGEVVQSHLLP